MLVFDIAGAPTLTGFTDVSQTCPYSWPLRQLAGSALMEPARGGVRWTINLW